MSLCEIYNAKCNIPFAGTYFLGGKLSYLNEYRGVPDPIELKKYRKDIVVPSDGGKGYVLLDNLECKIERSKKYSDCKNIILSGGCHLNCSVNFKLVKKYPEYNFFVDPIPYDAGTAVGGIIYYENYL